jgi:hypothetical protein
LFHFTYNINYIDYTERNEGKIKKKEKV